MNNAVKTSIPILIAALVVLLGWYGYGLLNKPARQSGDQGPSNQRPTGQVVQIMIDFGDRQLQDEVAWTPRMTAFDALKAQLKDPGRIDYSGSGETLFINSVDDYANQGGGDTNKNWVFWVNQTLGDRSSGDFQLDADDIVEWKYCTLPESEIDGDSNGS